jgi:hypothetical protein
MNRWYSIELYHINEESLDSLLLYIDSELIFKGRIASYQYKGCEMVTVGCEVDKNEVLSTNFTGAMQTVYFFEVSKKTISSTHNLFQSAYYSKVDLIDFLRANGAEESMKLLKKLYMFISPKYYTRTTKQDFKVDLITKRGKVIPLINNIQRVYRDTLVQHNKPVINTFFNIGGTKTLLPLLNKLSEQSTMHSIDNDTITLRFLEALHLTIERDEERAKDFFNQHYLQYLFEKVLYILK